MSRRADPGRGPTPRVPAGALLDQVSIRSFLTFMSRLVDASGTPLIVAGHHRRWAEEIVGPKRVVLMAPRSHGKTTFMLAYLLWRFWCHGRDPLTARRLLGPAGSFTAVLFSATRAQAEVLADLFRDLLLANAGLFPEETGSRPVGAPRRRAAWSRTHVRVENGAELHVRAYRSSTRGLHPDLLLLDDALSDANSGTEHQRNLTWRYFVGTLLPMHAGQIIVVGTAFHRADLLHRLGWPESGEALFEARRYRALDEDSHRALWPERYPYEELVALREFDPVAFSREYQNDPRDDASTVFPYELTQPALDAGANLGLLPTYRRAPDERVVCGIDLAISEGARADYTVAIVAAYELSTGRRRVLGVLRHRGGDLVTQVEELLDLCRRYQVDIAIVEQNAFQRWLVHELKKRAGGLLVIGHTTGQEKTDITDGVLLLKFALLARRWVMPFGDAEARRFARTWQAELAAFGWRDGRLEGIGEHDDTVIASWFVELAVRFIEQAFARPSEDIVTADDLGIERVHISPELDAVDRAAGVRDRFENWDG